MAAIPTPDTRQAPASTREIIAAGGHKRAPISIVAPAATNTILSNDMMVKITFCTLVRGRA